MAKLLKKDRTIIVCSVLSTLLMMLQPSSSSGETLPNNNKNDSTSSQDEKILHAQAAAYAAAFAAGDAATIANMWTPVGTYMLADGREFSGRPAIESLFASSFKKFGRRPLAINIESIRFPTANVAIEEGTTTFVKGDPAESTSRYVVVHIKKNDAWLMESVSETNLEPTATPSTLASMVWFIGNWTAQNAAGKTMHLKVDWNEKHTFIHCSYDTASAHDASHHLQIIGWNPTYHEITSWHFHPDGGFGYGRWYQSGQDWIENTNSIEPDGTKCSATYVQHKLNNDSFTWQSTKRSLAGSPLPDTQEITMIRELPAPVSAK